MIEMVAIDHQVAVEIMGWKLSPSGKTWRDHNGEYRERENNWRPHRNIDNAFRVLARMVKLGFSPGMACHSEHWLVTMHVDWGVPFDRIARMQQSRDPAHAICLAALRWIRGEHTSPEAIDAARETSRS